MKNIIFPGLILVISAACMGSDPENIPARAAYNEATKKKMVDHSATYIEVNSRTIICIDVNVDPSLWTSSVDSSARTGMGLFLARHLHAALSKRGIITDLSNYRANPDKNIPECATPGAVKINLKYEYDQNRKPFLVLQMVEKAGISISDSAKRDIESEWASGILNRIHKTNDMQTAISDDLEKRAQLTSLIFRN